MLKIRNVRRRISPTYLVFLWFGSFVLLGSALLWMPFSQVNPDAGLPFLSAVFTAVSAACVTGLSVVNVADTFTFEGQLVLFFLMEMGGMGIMTFASLGFRLLGRKLSMEQQAATADGIFQSDAAGEFRRVFKQILKVTLLIQFAGAVVMALCLLPHHWHVPGERGFLFWSAVFHAASAFCNSGFTIYRDGLASLLGNAPFLLAILALVVLGGLGHGVLNELYRLPRQRKKRDRRPRLLSLHTRVVLRMTLLLLAAGIPALWLLGVHAPGNGLWNAVFETVSGRTAGFSIVNQAAMPLPTVIVLIALMFVGGSPGSCAGGIKTTSLAIWMARIRANLRNDAAVNILGYTIAPELVSRARLLMALTMIWNVTGVFILSVCHPEQRLETLVFEQVSAFGTVGLSMDFTHLLNAPAQAWIIISMFIGRLGPLSIALWVTPSTRVNIHRPEGRIMVG